MSIDTISQQFNAYCAEAGIQCTVTSDPSDFRQLFQFKNVGDRLVKIEYDGDKRYLEPGEGVTLKVKQSIDLHRMSMSELLPKITAMNGGM